MRAVVLDARDRRPPWPSASSRSRYRPSAGCSSGQGVGLNRLEPYLRLGLSQGVTFPRVPGVEAAGVVEQLAEEPK